MRRIAGGLETDYEPHGDVFGRKSKAESGLQALFLNYSLNDTADVDYNKGGTPVDILRPISTPFVDNITTYSIVNAANCKGYVCSETGALNSKLKGILSDAKLEGRIKAIGLRNALLTEEQKETYKRLNPTTTATEYKRQYFKLALEDNDADAILTLLHEQAEQWAENNIYFNDIDFTLDCGGSFSKSKAIAELVETQGFRMAGSDIKRIADLEDGEGTILDNSRYVGDNCLTFITKLNGNTLRLKWYLKFVQMLESAGVRIQTGSHIVDWLNNPKTRLASTIKDCIDEGLTRLEITYSTLPRDMEHVGDDLEYLRGLLSIESLYKTPIMEQWKAYAETLKHTLVIHDDQNKLILYGWSYNSTTKKICGTLTKSATADKLDWILRRGAFAANLPIDYIATEMELGKVFNKSTGKESKRAVITGAKSKHTRYYRHGDDGTQLFSNNGLYYNLARIKKDIDLMDYGICDTSTIKPYLEKKYIGKGSKPAGELYQIGQTQHLTDKEKLYKTCAEYADAVRNIECSHALLDKQTEYRNQATEYKAVMRSNFSKLLDVPNGDTLDILAIRRMKTCAGYNYQITDGKTAYYGCDNIRNNLNLDRLYVEHTQENEGEILHRGGSALFTILKRGNKCVRGNKKAICDILYNDGTEAEGETLEHLPQEEIKNIEKRETTTRHKDLLRLETLTLGKKYRITHYAKIAYRKSTKYCLGIDHGEQMYLANCWMEDEIAKLLIAKGLDDIDQVATLTFKIGDTKTTKQKRKEALIHFSD